MHEPEELVATTSEAEASRKRQRLRRHLDRSAYWMDERFRVPGTPFRFGLDALVGLVPLAGDFVGYLIGLWLVFEARAAGAPRELQWKMMRNHGIELLVGWVPFIGDLFDVAWRAHSRNRSLAEEWLDAQKPAQPKKPARAIWPWVCLALGIGILIFWLNLAP